MTGTQNLVDNLYDIPIYCHHPNPKSSITENNYIMPTMHGIQRTIERLPKPPHKYYPRAKVKSVKNNIFHINSISHTNLDKLILQSNIQNKHSQSLNVILHKQ